MQAYWGTSAGGNFDGANILHVPNPRAAVAVRLGIAELDLQHVVDRARTALYEVRSRRKWPGRDEKIVTAWNALMLRSLAEAARVFDDAKLRAVAVRNAEFLWRELVRDGRALRIHKDGRSKGGGFLEDQAGLALALMEMYVLTCDPYWLDRAQLMTQRACEWFLDRDSGRFFDTAHDHERLIARPRDVADNATPSGQSTVAELMLLMAEYSGDARLGALGEGVLRQLVRAAVTNPMAFGQLLVVSDRLVHGSVQVVIAGDPATDESMRLQGVVRKAFIPSLTFGWGHDSAASGLLLNEGKVPLEGIATAYVCRRYDCDAPTHHPEELATQLQRAILPGS
jgi:uncharacterized protein YyaL (SSP411 family)